MSIKGSKFDCVESTIDTITSEKIGKTYWYNSTMNVPFGVIEYSEGGSCCIDEYFEYVSNKKGRKEIMEVHNNVFNDQLKKLQGMQVNEFSDIKLAELIGEGHTLSTSLFRQDSGSGSDGTGYTEFHDGKFIIGTHSGAFTMRFTRDREWAVSRVKELIQEEIQKLEKYLIKEEMK